jgi:hypothetical protein
MAASTTSRLMKVSTSILSMFRLPAAKHSQEISSAAHR